MKNYEFVPFQITCVSPSKNEGSPKPFPRSGHRMVYYNNSLYVFGGYNPDISEEEYDDETWRKNCPLFQELWKFNIHFNIWSRYATHDAMPLELASHSSVIHGPYMIVYGGTAMPFGSASSNSVHLCHLPSGSWRKLSTKGNSPIPMYGQAIYQKGDYLYVVGGTTGHEYSLEVHRLDLCTMVWNYMVPSFNKYLKLTKERYRHEIVEYKNSLLLFGGGTSDRAYRLTSLPSFDLKNQEWYLTRTSPDPETDNFPSSRKCHVLVHYKHYVFIHGGIAGQESLNDLWRLDLTTMIWNKLSCTTEAPMHFHSATISETGCLYLFGGIWENSCRTNKVLKVWIDIPPLLQICWEAVCHYFPSIRKLPPNDLLSMGVPNHFVQSLKDEVPAFG